MTEPIVRTSQQQREERRLQIEHRKRLALLTISCLTFLALGFIANYLSIARPVVIALYICSYITGSVTAVSKAWESLRQGSINVDLLMILAAVGAALVGEWPEGAVLLFLFSLSGTLEQIILGRTRGAIEALLDLAPEEATVVRDDSEVKVPIESVVQGDLVRVRPGERVPSDGAIVRGTTSVDLSALTGESIPVGKTVGEDVFAGTLNIDGAIDIRVSRAAQETMLARIVQRVEEAQSERATTQRFTEWFGERYTWCVLIGSAATFLGLDWLTELSSYEAFYRAMTVLVVASPCAVVMSIPAAFLSAIAGAARQGILFKGGRHLEAAASITAIALDKTGTLTAGRPAVVGVHSFSKLTEAELLELAASVEALSEHPLARAVVAAAVARSLPLRPVENLRAVIGKGVVVDIDGQSVVVGKQLLLEESGFKFSQTILAAAAEINDQGQTAIFIGRAGEVLGIVALADVLRPHALEAIDDLRKSGIKECLMLTGDHEGVARAMAKSLQMEYRADLMPEDKQREIRSLAGRSGPVAMVGDGINDAPALALSTLGISRGISGTAVALETADVVIMGDDLRKLGDIFRLGRRVQRVVKQNLIIAFGVMGFLLLSTFVLHLRLPIAVAGHEGSTVIVILNGLRLLRAERS